MFKAVATIALTMMLLGAALAACAAGETTGKSAAARKADVEERARQALAEHLGIAPDRVVVTRVQPRTWGDTSLGCLEPGRIALTIVTKGYAVSLRAQGGSHVVHVSEYGGVVMCNKRTPIHREPAGSANARGLDAMMELARQDLAQRLGVDAATIRLDGMRAQRWPDSGLGCPHADESIRPEPVDGFVLNLKHAGRAYTYHTDRQDVRACPAIESR